MVAAISPPEQYATSPSWPPLDMILCHHLGWLYHSVSCGLLSAHISKEMSISFSEDIHGPEIQQVAITKPELM